MGVYAVQAYIQGDVLSPETDPSRIAVEFVSQTLGDELKVRQGVSNCPMHHSLC